MRPGITYGEKLKDPRWQKKRLGILERANWRCSCCDAADSTLHVHHLQYVGDDPWDTPDEFLECLCEGCHGAREKANRFISDMFREASTKRIHQFSQNITIAVDLFKTAPERFQAEGWSNFVVTFMNHGIERVWADSPRVSVTDSDYTIFSEKAEN